MADGLVDAVLAHLVKGISKMLRQRQTPGHTLVRDTSALSEGSELYGTKTYVREIRTRHVRCSAE